MAITKIQSESMNLADTYAFTGTVTGAGGITEADVWRLNSDASTSNTRTVISSNLERADNTMATYIGTGMSVSSGIWTFPSTGKYLVEATLQYKADSDNRYVVSIIEATTDNSSYTRIAFGRSFIEYSYGTTYSQITASALIDVTDTSNVKVRFLSQSEGTASLNSHTDENATSFKFIRLGDT